MSEAETPQYSEPKHSPSLICDNAVHEPHWQTINLWAALGRPSAPAKCGGAMEPKDRKQSWTIWYVVVALLAVAFCSSLDYASQTEMIPYSQFEQLVSAKQVTDVVVSAELDPGHAQIAACRRQDASSPTVRVDPAIADKLEAAGVKVTGAPPGGVLGAILSWVLPAHRFLSSVDLPVPRHRREAGASAE